MTNSADGRGFVEIGVERIAGNVGDARRHSVDHLVDVHPTERPLIDEPHLAIIVGEAHAHAQVCFVVFARRLHEYLAAHAEVHDESLIPRAREWQPQVLASATGAAKGISFERGAQFRRAPLAATDRSSVQHVHAADRSIRRPCVDAATHHFDFGKFRHRWCRRGRRRPARPPLAQRPSCCDRVPSPERRRRLPPAR